MEDVYRTIASEVNKDPLDEVSFEDLVKETGGTLPEEPQEKVELTKTPDQILSGAKSPADKSFLGRMFQNASPNPAAGISPSPGSVGAEISSPSGKEQPKGASMAAQATAGVAESLSQFAYDILDGADNMAVEYGVTQEELLSPHKFDWKSKFQSKDDDVATRVGAELLQYMAPGIALASKFKLGMGSAAAANVALDFTLMDPNQDRLADVITNAAPELRQWAALGDALTYLEKDPEEGKFEARFKNGLESTFVNALGLSPAMAKSFYSQIKAQRAVRAMEAAASGAPARIVSDVVESGLKFKNPLLNPENPNYEALSQLGMRELDSIAPRTTHAEVIGEAKKIIENEASLNALLAKAGKGEAFTAAEGQAFRELHANAMNEIVEASKTVDLNNPAVIAEFQTRLLALSGGQKASLAAGRTTAQALEARKSPVGTRLLDFEKALTGEARARHIENLTKFAGGTKETKRLLELMQGVDSADASRYFEMMAAEGTIPKMLNSLQFGMYGAMLGVKSVGSALVGNLGNTAVGVADTLTAYGLRTLQNSDSYRYLRGMPKLGEMEKKASQLRLAASLKGYQEGLVGSFKGFWKPEMNKFKSHKVDFVPQPGSALVTMGISPDDNIAWKTWGRLMQTVGLNGYSMKLLGKADEFFGGIHYRTRLQELAHDRAMRINPADAKTYESMVQEFVGNPYIDDHKAAMGYAEEMVLAKKAPEDSLVGLITENKWLKTILPFTRVTYNSAKFSIEHSPFAVVTSNYKQIMKTGTQAMKDEALAKVIVGSGAMSALYAMGMNDQISGAVSPNWRVNQALADSGNEPKPYTIMGVSVDKIDTIRPWIDLAHTVAQANKYLDQDQMDDLMVNVGAAVTSFFTSNMLLENISDIADLWSAIGNGDVKGPEEAKKFAVNFAGRFAPKMIREAGQSLDLYTSGEYYRRRLKASGDGLTKLEEFTSEIKNHYSSLVPAFNKELPVYQNIFGEPQQLAPGFGPDVISPLTEAGKESQVMERLRILSNASEKFGPLVNDSLKLAVSMPQNTIRIPAEIGGVSNMPFEMTPQQYERFMTYFGNKHKGARGPTLREELASKLSDDSPLWKALMKEQTPDDYKKIFNEIHESFTNANKRAKFMMLSQEPEFSMQYEAKKKAWTTKPVRLLPPSMLGAQ